MEWACDQVARLRGCRGAWLSPWLLASPRGLIRKVGRGDEERRRGGEDKPECGLVGAVRQGIVYV